MAVSAAPCRSRRGPAGCRAGSGRPSAAGPRRRRFGKARPPLGTVSRQPVRADRHWPPGGAGAAPAHAPRGGTAARGRPARPRRPGARPAVRRPRWRWTGAVCRPGSRPMSSAAMVTARKAVWCQRNSVIADRLTVATAAQASGRLITWPARFPQQQREPGLGDAEGHHGECGRVQVGDVGAVDADHAGRVPGEQHQRRGGRDPAGEQQGRAPRPANAPRAQAIPSR